MLLLRLLLKNFGVVTGIMDSFSQVPHLTTPSEQSKMNKKTFSYAMAAAFSVVAFASSVQAADGTIDFTGIVNGQTCTINGGGAGKNFSVALPPVSTSALATAGEWAGRTQFSIKLTDCVPDSGLVSTRFESGPTVNLGSGSLIIDTALGAKNVEIGLLNSDYSKIMVGAPEASQNSKSVSMTAGTATLNYFAQYEATGVSEPGAANTRVQYTMIYQ